MNVKKALMIYAGFVACSLVTAYLVRPVAVKYSVPLLNNI